MSEPRLDYPVRASGPLDSRVPHLLDKAAGLDVEVERVEATLRARFGDEHELLQPGVFRGTLWMQAAAWELIYNNEPRRRRRGEGSRRAAHS